jgi:wobble nucleotide-excising tRNase
MAEKINELKIDLDLVPALKSTATEQIISPLNDSLEKLLQKVGELKGKINKQKRSIIDKIEKYKIQINEFLKYAGYKYIIDIQEVNEEYKLRLQHSDISFFVENGNQHLSYGEKNAFALMLFMYDCLSKNPNLIILDDPISSFDKNKKFAIIDRLFRGEKSLKGKTVLMLTHDIDPIIDMFKVLYGKIEPVPIKL